jgi:hypothetical protein
MSTATVHPLLPRGHQLSYLTAHGPVAANRVHGRELKFQGISICGQLSHWGCSLSYLTAPGPVAANGNHKTKKFIREEKL